MMFRPEAACQLLAFARALQDSQSRCPQSQVVKVGGCAHVSPWRAAKADGSQEWLRRKLSSETDHCLSLRPRIGKEEIVMIMMMTLMMTIIQKYLLSIYFTPGMVLSSLTVNSHLLFAVTV